MQTLKHCQHIALATAYTSIVSTASTKANINFQYTNIIHQLLQYQYKFQNKVPALDICQSVKMNGLQSPGTEMTVGLLASRDNYHKQHCKGQQICCSLSFHCVPNMSQWSELFYKGISTLCAMHLIQTMTNNSLHFVDGK